MSRPLGEPYHMIRSFELERFRGFRKLEVKNLRRINILVGPNASGKTAFLEGLGIAARAVPFAAGLIIAGRNLVPIGLLTPKAFEDFWSTLFFDLNITDPIYFSY